MFKKIAIFLILITWPVSLFLSNTPKDFISYVLPLFNPKFAILPLLFVLIYFKLKKTTLIVVSTTILIIFFKPFYGQSIFITNNDAKQSLVQKGNLYNSIFLARLFQNKARIPLNKISSNFLALTDPNNYFFGFAPGQIKVDNQNLKKFTFLSLPFMLVGLYHLTKLKHFKLTISFLVAAIINLSLLTNFDRNDFILWIPISLIIIHGYKIFNKRFKYAKYYELLFVLLSLVEIARLFITANT